MTVKEIRPDRVFYSSRVGRVGSLAIPAYGLSHSFYGLHALDVEAE